LTEIGTLISDQQESMNRGKRSGIARPIRMTEKLKASDEGGHPKVA
jgi:hypothetical protein